VLVAADFLKFYDEAEEIATRIVADHHGSGTTRSWCFAVWAGPPSIASGAGSLTAMVFACVEYRFTSPMGRIDRTRKFTMFHPDAAECWPSGNMRLLWTPGPGAASEGRIGFFLHVGNRISESWGVLSGWRDRNLVRAVDSARAEIRRRRRYPTNEHDGWIDDYRQSDDMGYWAV
jgi:hypothetical protein